MRNLGSILIAIILLVAGAAGGWWLTRPDPNSVASGGLDSLRLQNRLSVMRAQFVSVQTKQKTAYLMFTAQRTLILPGSVGYEVDLAKLRDSDIEWDPLKHILHVTAPPVEITGPEVDLLGMRVFDTGQVARWVSNADVQLDVATKQSAIGNLRQQAESPRIMKIARDAARTAIQTNFALPLKAAGIKAEVDVRFADEPVARSITQMDRSRSLQDVYESGNRVTER